VSPIVIAALAAFNLGLIFLLMTAPLGLRTVRVSRLVAADRHRLWQALWPFGRSVVSKPGAGSWRWGR